MQATTTRISPLSIATQRAETQDVQDFPVALPTLSEDTLAMLFTSFLGQLFPHQGLLLLDSTGQLLQSTDKAQDLCQSIDLATAPATYQAPQSIVLPQQVKTLCEFLIDSRLEFPGQSLQLSDDLFFDNGLRIHLSAEWVALAGRSTPCMLVRLEDITQIAGQRALCDAYRYGLTQRETEVWALYLQGLTYRQICDRLFIALSTVKKHMKSVYSKRRGELF